jgi:hypothetical protein
MRRGGFRLPAELAEVLMEEVLDRPSRDAIRDDRFSDDVFVCGMIGSLNASPTGVFD